MDGLEGYLDVLKGLGLGGLVIWWLVRDREKIEARAKAAEAGWMAEKDLRLADKVGMIERQEIATTKAIEAAHETAESMSQLANAVGELTEGFAGLKSRGRATKET